MPELDLNLGLSTATTPRPAGRSREPALAAFPVLSAADLSVPETDDPPTDQVAALDDDEFHFGDELIPTQPGELEPELSLALPPLRASSERVEPALQEPEVSAALLSESMSTELPGDLSGQWSSQAAQVDEPVAVASPAPVEAPAPHEEVDAYGRAEQIQGLLFLRQARRRAFWRKPWVLALQALLVVVSAVVLLLQVTYHERDRLAAMEPRLKPWLTALCQPLDCSLAPLRRIEPIQIDSSSFNKTRGEAYQLSLSLRNTGHLPLATPAAELTLTDSQDHVVLRRVFRPAELGAPEVLPAGADWSASLPMAIAGAAALNISGYRVLVFYP